VTSNVTLNAPTVGGGSTIATEDIGGVQFQRVKLALGSSGQDLGDVSGTNPMVVEMGGASVGAFGDLITSENTPLIQGDFVYGINTQTGVTSVVGTGVADTNAARLRLQTGTGATGAATFMSRKSAKYRAGQGVTGRFTKVFTAGAASSQQIAGFGSTSNGYFFGYNGVDYGILHRNAGADTWVAQGSWNGDKCNGTGASGFTINPAFGNVYQIRYPYLGYGVITFWVLNPAIGRWLLAHMIQYPNTTATTQLSNPNLNYFDQVLNTGNTTNIISYAGSYAALLSGSRSFTANPKWAFDNNKTGITAETNLFSLRNATTYNGVENKGMLRLNSLSFAVTANTANLLAVCRLRIGATLGGTATYATINGTTADNGVTITAGNSIASANTVHTTATGGTYIFNLSVSGQSNSVVDLAPFDLYFSPGEILTVSGFATASASISASLNWSEDL
jgi:hypothetical protein